MILSRNLGRSPVRVTTLGFGGGAVGHLAGSDAGQQTLDAVATAWESGIRYFDTAPLYGRGRSELRLGAALRMRPREEFVLSTKIGRYVEPGTVDKLVYDYSRDGARRALDQSLERLGLDRADIVLIHDIDRWTFGEHQPTRFGEALDGAYRALSDLKAEGAIRAIGIGVNEWQVCDAFVQRAPIDCVLLAGRHTLIEQDAAEFFLPTCIEKGVGVIVGGPYNSGILATGPVAGATYNYGPAPALLADRVRRLQTLCEAYGVPLPAAALAFPLFHPAVATVVPGMASASDVAETVAWAAKDVPLRLWEALRDAGLIQIPKQLTG